MRSVVPDTVTAARTANGIADSEQKPTEREAQHEERREDDAGKRELRAVAESHHARQNSETELRNELCGEEQQSGCDERVRTAIREPGDDPQREDRGREQEDPDER